MTDLIKDTSANDARMKAEDIGHDIDVLLGVASILGDEPIAQAIVKMIDEDWLLAEQVERIMAACKRFVGEITP